MSQSSKKISELLTDLAAIVDDECRKLGPDSLGERVAFRVSQEWGGNQFYIPFDKNRRNREMFALFTGDNYSALSRMFHKAEGTVRKIIE